MRTNSPMLDSACAIGGGDSPPSGPPSKPQSFGGVDELEGLLYTDPEESSIAEFDIVQATLS